MLGPAKMVGSLNTSPRRFPPTAVRAERLQYSRLVRHLYREPLCSVLRPEIVPRSRGIGRQFHHVAPYAAAGTVTLGFATPLAATLGVSVMMVAAVSVHWRNGFFITEGGYEFTSCSERRR